MQVVALAREINKKHSIKRPREFLDLPPASSIATIKSGFIKVILIGADIPI
jgi:hypothetical protein